MKRRSIDCGISLFLVGSLCCAFSFRAPAADFRISFLDQPSTLHDTCALLEAAGVSAEAVKTFQALVKWQNENGNGVDTTRFPLLENGYYRFHGSQDFTNRITDVFGNAHGKPTLMCFDVASLLLKSAGCRADTLPQNSDSSSFIDVTPERAVRPFPKGAARTGTNILIPQNFYSALVGQPRSEAETRLGVSLHAARRLASKITDTDVGLREAFEDFVAGIKQDGFVFPERFKLGLVFYVDVKRRFIKTDHAFVVIPKGDVLAVVEKDNSPGPYVRADFESEKDLVEYVSLGERRDTNNPKDVDYSSSVIVSLNDRLASIFHPSRQP